MPKADNRHDDLRKAIVSTARAMNASGINQGSSGNLSHRVEGGLLITPSGLDYAAMEADDIVFLRMDGSYEGKWRPSSEWRFHRDILAAREDVDVVLHNHATYATALACHGRPIPPFHYMTAIAGGHDIPIAPYACFGTQELSDGVLAALEGRKACLMAHHGMIAIAPTLDKALALAIEVETLARMYLAAQVLGEPPHLTKEQMDEVMAQIRGSGYGQPSRSED